MEHKSQQSRTGCNSPRLDPKYVLHSERVISGEGKTFSVSLLFFFFFFPGERNKHDELYSS